MKSTNFHQNEWILVKWVLLTPQTRPWGAKWPGPRGSRARAWEIHARAWTDHARAGNVHARGWIFHGCGLLVWVVGVGLLVWAVGVDVGVDAGVGCWSGLLLWVVGVGRWCGCWSGLVVVLVWLVNDD